MFNASTKRSADQIDVYLEIGKKRVFASAVEWPGWCRSGRDAGAALRALLEYGPRYAAVLRKAGLEFQAPTAITALAVVERLAGNTTTDFGAPDMAPAADARPVDDAELQRFETLLRACWGAFDAATAAATGKELRSGPRGGGRTLEGISRHVLGADAGYLSRLARKLARQEDADVREELGRARQAIWDALAAAAHGEIPERGPRGGTYWTPRYFVRRVAWHTLGHAWEIEDRIV